MTASATIVAENDAAFTKFSVINSSNKRSYKRNFFQMIKSDSQGTNSTSTIDIRTIGTNSTQIDGKNKTGDNEPLTVQTPNIVCRIVTSADYKIPSLSSLQRQTQSGREEEQQQEHEL